MSAPKNHALITGATGISGWSLMHTCLEYPSRDTFARVTGLANRKRTLAEADLPTNDARLLLVCGIDLTKPASTVTQLLRASVSDIDTVSHVFLTAYAESHEPAIQTSVNRALVRNAVEAIVELTRESGSLKHVCLQTGGKWYGLEHVPKIPYPVPVKEEFPRISSPYGDEIFYYDQMDAISAIRATQNQTIPEAETNGDSTGEALWTVSDVRPDAIIGHCPSSNAMSLSLGLGMFLALWRLVHGNGSVCPWPGTERSYACKFTDTSQVILAKLEIWTSLKCSEGDPRVLSYPHFNAADYDKPTCWAEKWPRLCEYWGLEGAGPVKGTVKFKDDGALNNPLEDFVKQHEVQWKTTAKEQGLRSQEWVEIHNWAFIWWTYMNLDWDRQYDMSRVRAAGFDEKSDVFDGYMIGWKKMKELKVLPTL